MSTNFDVIVIGTGQSGPALAHELASEGRKVAVIERNEFGGSCVNFGCTPTKAYVASAQVAHFARHGAEYGVNAGEVTVDLKRVKARKDELVAQSSEGLEKSLRDNENITVIEGHARFVGPKQVKANDDTLTAEQIVINVGARANVPPINGLDGVPWLSATGMLELEEVPAHLAIIGGGYIGMEFAQMFRRFGSDVTVIQRGPRLLEREDEDVSDGVESILEDEGVTVYTGTEPKRVEETDRGIRIELQGNADRAEIEPTHLLVATGRVPNTDTLGASEAGLDLDDRGYIKVNEHLQTSVEGVYALGDCNGRGAFTHTSYNDYELLRDHLLGEGRRKLSDRIPAHAVYIDPPLARVGVTESEARERNLRVLKGSMKMTGVARAREAGQTQGLMKVLVDEQSGRILGAAILGLHGDEVIHSLLDVMYADKPYTVVRDAVHIHPTVSELVPTMLESLEPLR